MEIGNKNLTLQQLILELSSVESAIRVAFESHLNADIEDWTEFGLMLQDCGNRIQTLGALTKSSAVQINAGTQSMLCALSKWIPNSKLRFDAGRLETTYKITV